MAILDEKGRRISHRRPLHLERKLPAEANPGAVGSHILCILPRTEVKHKTPQTPQRQGKHAQTQGKTSNQKPKGFPVTGEGKPERQGNLNENTLHPGRAHSKSNVVGYIRPILYILPHRVAEK